MIRESSWFILIRDEVSCGKMRNKYSNQGFGIAK